MNALYARISGEIVDPLGGLLDALAGRVVFIENAQARIREDYLRILRFFRFWAYYGQHEDGFDPEVLAAIAETLDGLEQLSAERVGNELMKLLAAPNPSMAVATMNQIGVFARILPIISADVLPRLVHFEEVTQTPPDALRRLAVLGPQDAKERLRMSKRDLRDLEGLRQAAGDSHGPKALGHIWGAQRGWDAILVRAASLEVPPAPDDRDAVIFGAQAVFPIKAADIALEGPELGARLKKLKADWLGSELTLTKTQLLG